MTSGSPFPSLVQTADALRTRRVSPVELVQDALARARRLQPRLNCFITVLGEQAIEEARRAQQEIGLGRYRGPLHGIPYTAKDLFATAGVRTTAGSRVLADWVPEEDAAVVARLRAAGAVLLGKTNTSEFAAGPTNANEHYGPARNPWDLDRVPGGSSGGSAAALAAGIGVFSVGTDTGGSIRMPAAACGVVGLKPSIGCVPRRGVVMLSWSLDTVGVLAHCVEDGARVLACIGAVDEGQADAAPSPTRIGVPTEMLEEPCDGEVRTLFTAALARAGERGARVEQISMPWARHALPANNLISWFESWLVHERMFAKHAKTYGQTMRRRLLMGAAVGIEGYRAAIRIRHAFTRRVEDLLRRVDVLALPTLSVPAPPVGVEEVEVAGLRVPILDALGRFTRLASFTGQPALSLPVGLTTGGLPVGVQLIGRIGQDHRLWQIAREFEAAIGWTRPQPTGLS
ncbi:MAG TPA: amidase [Methylomirabilota bacterium]|jgi:aspartyl-tRNA(Asn)/glutamyl-tRNA(Gln) amidotransferase subunit A